MKTISGGVCAPKGFRAAGVHAGIKKDPEKKDCALIVSDEAAPVAGMFTTNVMKSPAVVWDAAVCAKGTARAVFINSGNANAATGDRGVADVCQTAQWVGEELEAPAEIICVCSTGVIGVPLPMDKIEAGVRACAAHLSTSGSANAAQAIMTTDTVPKELAVELALNGGTVRIGAIAKGSGMVSPNLATMICVLTTDAAIHAEPLHALLRHAVHRSFNCISIDNDMSTSDTVLLIASGRSKAEFHPGEKDYRMFGDALTEFCQEMAKRLVRDAEGGTKCVEIIVEGAVNEDGARRIARAIGNSQLCKTAFFGNDPNWGRFVCAAGYAGVDFDPADISLWLDHCQLVKDGQVAPYKEEEAAAVMRQREFRIRLRVGGGSGHAVYWASDLSYDYVRINAAYRT